MACTPKPLRRQHKKYRRAMLDHQRIFSKRTGIPLRALEGVPLDRVWQEIERRIRGDK